MASPACGPVPNVVLATEHYVDCVCSMCTIIVCMLVRMRVVIIRV